MNWRGEEKGGVKEGEKERGECEREGKRWRGGLPD